MPISPSIPALQRIVRHRLSKDPHPKLAEPMVLASLSLADAAVVYYHNMPPSIFYQYSAAHRAVLKNNLKELRDSFVANGQVIHVATPVLGQTPLHYAAKMGQLDNAEFLIKSGADLFAKNKQGQTPYDYARRVQIPGKEKDSFATSLCSFWNQSCGRGLRPDSTNARAQTAAQNIKRLGLK